METPLRFGILGTGNIAHQFADGVAHARHSSIAAVGSRSDESARAFGAEYEINNAMCFGSYDQLIACDAIDAVYVSLPNHLHAPWTIKALEAGKHVLCEKPFAMDTAEAEAMFAASQRTGKRLMEAFMYRCHPLMDAVRDEVTSGSIGELRMIRASFCYRTSNIDQNVRFQPDIGGGALMDIGSYCLSFARFIAGREPSAAHIVGHQHATGVDDYATAVLRFDEDPAQPEPLRGTITAALTFGMTVQLNNTAHLGGTDGHLQVPIPWKPPASGGTYILGGQTPPRQDLADGKPGPPEPKAVTIASPAPLYGQQADAFALAVHAGTPMPVTRDDTLGNMRLINELNRQLRAAF
ncbi:Gfo/Idh/MocA family oxidoreductase [Algisphaera agarilytica]|uniref:Putative dehydrogenase n=1 Tax=Algisphaera agarilytica TaxID=1385975 RepID=A0A7X0LJP7_9BACT|nr:Gfo/Idh/MocA family oxidoreductase [Algisphaera agarilytica]MBB6429062.1 putative dehydrogenase [Algisphaera agarilytica]